MPKRADLPEDERRYREAADAGDADALNKLGLLLWERGEPNKAERWYRSAIDAGLEQRDDATATDAEAEAHFTADEKRWRRNRNTAHIKAMLRLGNAMSDMGFLRERQGDREGAEQWYRRGAAAGNQRARDNLRILLGEHRNASPSGHGIASSDYGGGHYALGFNY
jgi:TPR repeat protein